jgi:EmrB/QacA subfamily drug resistance transporter
MIQNKRGLILLGVILAMLLSALDQTIVATAMPQITEELNGLSHLSWVFTAYMLTSTITVPIYGKLSDIFGRRGLYILGIAIFLIGSILSGLSQNMTQLILFRGLQGIGGGSMMVNALATIGDLFAPAERGKWQGVMGGIFGLATIVGPLLGGWLTDNFSWRWIFYVNIPVGIIAMITIASAMPKIARNTKDRSIDFAGAVLIAVGLIPLLLAFVWAGSQYDWGSWQIIGLLCFAAAALFVFALVERRVREPVLSLNLFKNKVFAVSVIAIFLTTMGMFGAILYVTVFAQGVVGISATNSGLVLMPMMIGLIIASAISGLIISRTGKYKVMTVLGLIVSVFGMFLFSRIDTSTTQLALIVRMVMLGVGLGITMPVFTITVQSAFGQEKLGEVTAGSQLFRGIGGTVGTAVLGGIMNSQLASRLTNIQNDPFVASMKQLDPSSAIGNINGNTVQGLLSAAGQAQMKAALAQAPQPLQSQLTGSFNHFLDSIKVAFSSSLDHVFLIGTIIMGIALVAVFFLPEIKLRKSNQKAVTEAGMELEAELAQSDSKNEPEL